MRGTVKFLDSSKGWGFITDSDGKDHFVHRSSIQMYGIRPLDECDIVDFEIGLGTNGREQAVNVIPVLTLSMVKTALRKENLHLDTMSDSYGAKKYLVVDADNVLQTSEQGMTLEEIWDWLNDCKELLEDSMKFPCI